MPEDKIPADMRHYGDLFLTEDAASAYAKLEVWVFDKENTDQETARRIAVARDLLARGGYVSARYRDHERWIDPLIAKINAEKGNNWLALREAARILDFRFLDHSGVLSEGGFLRGEKTGGPMRYSHDPDRFHAIVHFQRAIALCKRAIEEGKAKPDDLAELYLDLADCLEKREPPEADFLTDLETEPGLAARARNRWKTDPDGILVEGRDPALGADGKILLPAPAASFEDAPSDLSRQRWLIEEAARISPKYHAEAQLKLAKLWWMWLGVDALVSAGYLYVEGTESELDPDAPGEFELHTLKSDQTILVTADGPKRVTIPPGFRFIEILENLIADPKTPHKERIDACGYLLEILSNRRQFDRAEKLALELKKRPPEDQYAHSTANGFLRDIEPAGRFLGTDPFIAGRGIELKFISRNMEKLYLELWCLDVEKAVSDSDALDRIFRHYSYGNAGGHIDARYRDELLPYYKSVRQWTTSVEKRPRHLQGLARIPIEPLEVGSYYLVARGCGQTLGLPIQVEETMLVGTRIDAETANYLLLDSKTGKPVTDAEIIPMRGGSDGSFFPDHLGVFSTDENLRLVLIRRPEYLPEFKLLEYATMDGGDPTSHLEIKTFFVTNQPLYRPGQTVNFSCWLRQLGNRWFDAPRVYRDTKIRVLVEDPTGAVIYSGIYEPDDFGAVSGSFPLGPAIALGTCDIKLESMGSLSKPGTFSGDPFGPETWNHLDDWRIEVGEFRKPDFRVEVEAADTPHEGSVAVILSASYNSGEPMRGAEVMGELTAYPTATTLFPKSKFERDYDAGYDWPLPESRWMPDWQAWGTRHYLLGEDESDYFINASPITREITASTGEDGKAHLVFSGKLPRLGQLSYHCEIRAAVKESSGRTMVGGLQFIESGLSKALFIRPGKGFYKAGEEITLTLNAMDPEREPVSATGSLRVDRLGYEGEDRAPAYEMVLERGVSFGDEGQTTVSFAPPEPGQYLFMFTSGDARRGIVLNVLADGYDARDLRFNPIQLTPDHSVRAPGEKIEVAIHCDKPDALVWLFQLMPDGRRQTPRMIQMRGKVAVVEIVAPLNGAPNFQLLAMTAGNGTVEHARCQISLPPRESILAVELTSAPEKPKPGEPVSLALSVRDHLGEPTRASFAITAYDRSLDDLAKPLPQTRSLLPRSFDPLWGENPLPVANRDGYRDTEAFRQLWEPGCFSDRSGLVGEIVRNKESRFSKVGDELLIAYELPELPNSVGATGGASFPVTPATPTTYSRYTRPTANRIDLEKDAAASLKNTAARKNFADYAHWGAAVTTDDQGHAKISFPLPDNLTAWKAQAWAFGQANRFGDAELEITASKPLQIRPVLPRSAVHGDKLGIAASIQNLSDRAAEFHLLLEVRDLETSLPGGNGETKSVTIPAGGEGFVTWPVELLAAGTANFRFLARSTDGSLTDGTELPLIVAPRTTPFIVAASETMDRNETVQEMNLNLSGMPAEATLRLRFSSQSSIDAFGAVPELASYPFGCVEQTLNRFLPLLIASRKFEAMDGDWDALMKQVAVADDSRGWIRGRPLLHMETAREPLTAKKTDILVRAGLKRLHDMANEDDSWGWFKGGEPSPYLTALVIRASLVAKRLGYEFEEGGKPVERISTRWLESHAGTRAEALRAPKSVIQPEDAFITYVLSLSEKKEHAALQGILLKQSDKLALSARIFLALSLDPQKQADALAKLLPAIHQEMRTPDDMTTDYRPWWQDSTETRAWYLMLLTHLDPDDTRIPEQVERLLAMRTNGLLWKSTRDTALSVEAIAGTLSVFDLGTGSTPEIPLGIEIAGKTIEANLKSVNFWTQELSVPITRDQLMDGHLRLTIQRKGASKSIVRASATVRYDTDAAEHLTASSNGLQIHRNYYLIRNGEDPLPIENGAEVIAGDLIEVELKVNAPQPRDFVHISDPIPAGLEPLHQLSGQENGAYRETRLGEFHLFIQRLDRWNGTFRYRCHAVTPGTSHALPTRVECMYAPSIFGSTPSATLTVLPKPAR